MKNTIALTLLFVFVLLGCKQNKPESNPLQNKPEPESWLQDAGFGMFIHWSFDSQLGIVISHSMVGASDDYLKRYINELPKTFNPTDFDPERIAVLAKLTGMKYVVFTTKHHSGFCMWDTKTTDFDIKKTPYKQDIVRQYVEAMRKHDLGVGFYFSPEDFYFLHTNNQEIKRRGIEDIPDDIKQKYIDYTIEQCKELMTNYGPIDVMFFDGGIPEVLEAAKKTCWQYQPDILVTRGEIPTPEQALPGIPIEGPWESCITMGTQWQYKPTNENYKSAARLIDILIETRAKGGALLLNVGPDPYGKIPVEQEERLREIAAWNFINQESILNTRPWIVTNEANVWFTSNKEQNVVYAIVTGIRDWKRGTRKEIVLFSVTATKETKITVLGQSDERVEYQPAIDAASQFTQTESGLVISVVKAQRIYNLQTGTDNPLVIKLENIKPAFVPPAVKTGNAKAMDNTLNINGTLLSTGDADTVRVAVEYREYAGFGFELYTNEWHRSETKKMSHPGDFEISIKNINTARTYQYRCVVLHPKIEIPGEMKQVLIE